MRRLALLLIAAFAFRLAFGLCSEFWFEDETQVFLLGLRCYAGGQWPYYGPDIGGIRAQLPGGAYEHRQLNCPWDAKGRVMRTMVEMHREQAVDLADGIKVFVDGGWVLVLPDPDLPRYHVIVSVQDAGQAKELADRYDALVTAAVGNEGGGTPSSPVVA